MATTYYEFKDEKSNKFWEIEVNGKTVTVRYGKIGTDGQTTVKSFANASEADAHASKVTAEKTRKGYKKAKRPVSSKAKATGAKKKASGKKPNQSAPDWQAIEVPPAVLKAFAKRSTKPKGTPLRPNLAKAVDGLKAGTLLIDNFASLEEVRAVLQHPNARKIEAIQLTSWSDEAREKTIAQYRKRAQELSELPALQGFTLPNFIFDVAYFYMKATAETILGFRFDWDEVNGLEILAESYLLQHVLNSKADLVCGIDLLMRDRYAGLHPFYYVPLADYGSDAVTWGLAYDFEKGELFDGLVCHDLGLDLRCFWHSACESLQTNMEWVAADMDLAEDDEDGESSLEEQSFLRLWLGSRLMVGYLQKFTVACACRNIKTRYRQFQRYGEDVWTAFAEGRGDQALLSTIRMPGLNRHRIGAILEAILAVPYSDEECRARTAKELEGMTNPTPIERELAEILSSGKTGDGWDRVLSLVRAAAEAGTPGIALHAANQLVSLNANAERYGKAAQLLQVVPDAFCPPFIKAICVAHAKASDVT